MNNPTLIRLSLVKGRTLLFRAAVLFLAASILAQTASAQSRDSGEDVVGAAGQLTSATGATKMGDQIDFTG